MSTGLVAAGYAHSMAVEAFVVGALIKLAEDTDPAAVGAAVTTALCGRWEHEGPCRWPHNNAMDTTRSPVRFRTLYVAVRDEADEVERRICEALHAGAGWQVVTSERRLVDGADALLAERLLSGPRAAA